MEKGRRIAAVGIFVALVALLAFLAVLFDRPYDIRALDNEDEFSPSNLESPLFSLSENDKDYVIDEANATIVEFTDEKIERYVITKGGQYVLRGRLVGNVRVDANDEIVHIVLDGLTIKSDAGPAIYVHSADKVIITVSGGSENNFRDSTNYYDYSDSKACIFSNPDLTVNGTGTLYVYGDYKGGIRTRGVLKILGSDINVRGKSDGIRGNDGVYISPADITVECEGSGIVTTNAKKLKGDVMIKGGNIQITAGKYGIESAKDITIIDCNDNIYGVLSGYKYGDSVN